MTVDPVRHDGSAPGFQAALRTHEQGRLDEAESLYLALFATDPGNFQTVLHLGVLRLQQGRIEDAIALTRQALELDPTSAEACANLAAALHMLRRDDEAIESYESALGLDPDRAESHYGLGVALLAKEQPDEAIACFERALTIDPDYAEANCALGDALRALKHHDRALACYDEALDVDPDYVEALLGRGSALRGLTREGEAIGSYGRALEIAPDNVEALNALAAALQGANRHQEALAHLRRALIVKPLSGKTQLSLGAILEELGRTEEAQRAFATAIEIEPENVRFRVALTTSKRVRDGDPDLAAMEAWARTIDERPPDEQLLLHFGLGKAFSDVGRNEQSFSHLLAGNALRRQQLAYDEAATLATFDRIRATFTTEFMNERQGAGYSSPLPIFIVGMPRSGSTLIEQVLASHPRVFGGGERHDLADAMITVVGKGARTAYPEMVRGLTASQIYRIGARYVERLEAAAAGSMKSERITDKMLANFCFAGLIHLALPHARIVHSRRDPIDTCLSCFSQLFAAEQPFAYDLGELGRFYRAYSTLMAHWRRVIPAGVVLDVDYEELVADFEVQARRLIAHCGLEWDAACLSFHQTERLVRTASVTQVRQPIYKSSVGRWRPDPERMRPLVEGLGMR
jgi:tetratricopeptide (TPR) repeat protein